jgi:hypothetical protein
MLRKKPVLDSKSEESHIAAIALLFYIILIFPGCEI